jgi:hypothetical protein
MSKHPKTTTPSDKDLKRNPPIGSSKGTTMTGATAEELEDLEGENTFEGDEENDANRYGGIDKGEKPDHRRNHH